MQSKIYEIAGSDFVILTGDFNFLGDREAYQNLFTKQNLLKDAFKISKQKVGEQTGTCCGFNNSDSHDKRIDYILVSNKLTVSDYRVISDQENSRYPSDQNKIQ